MLLPVRVCSGVYEVDRASVLGNSTCETDTVVSEKSSTSTTVIAIVAGVTGLLVGIWIVFCCRARCKKEKGVKYSTVSQELTGVTSGSNGMGNGMAGSGFVDLNELGNENTTKSYYTNSAMNSNGSEVDFTGDAGTVVYHSSGENQKMFVFNDSTPTKVKVHGEYDTLQSVAGRTITLDDIQSPDLKGDFRVRYSGEEGLVESPTNASKTFGDPRHLYPTRSRNAGDTYGTYASIKLVEDVQPPQDAYATRSRVAGGGDGFGTFASVNLVEEAAGGTYTRSRTAKGMASSSYGTYQSIKLTMDQEDVGVDE